MNYEEIFNLTREPVPAGQNVNYPVFEPTKTDIIFDYPVFSKLDPHPFYNDIFYNISSKTCESIILKNRKENKKRYKHLKNKCKKIKNDTERERQLKYLKKKYVIVKK